MRKITFVIFALTVFMKPATAQDSLYSSRNGQLLLTPTGAAHFAALPLRCAEKEWPYKTGITFSDSSLLTAPQNYHPAFFGCFDWHSSVHGHWMLARLLKTFPTLKEGPAIRQLFNKHFTEKNMEQEILIFKNKENRGFERTYGWAWLLQLEDELLQWNDPDAQRWAAALQPLANTLSQLTVGYLDKLVYPIRVGEHSNLAFGLSMMYDYAQHQKDTVLGHAIQKAAMRFYFKDDNCPFDWEPGGNDFLSPCLEEADLMRKILPATTYTSWIRHFMPRLFDETFTMAPGVVNDRTDGKLIHLDGLNLSRAWCLKGIAAVTKNKHILQLANEHLLASLPQVASGNYEGEHWLASFAVYALLVE